MEDAMERGERWPASPDPPAGDEERGEAGARPAGRRRPMSVARRLAALMADVVGEWGVRAVYTRLVPLHSAETLRSVRLAELAM